MPTQPLGEGVLLHALQTYHDAVAAGGVPLGQHVGTGKVSAMTMAAKVMGIQRNGAMRRIKTALKRFPDFGMSFVSGPAPADAEDMAPDGMVIATMSGAYNAAGALERQWIGTVRAPGAEYAVPVGHVVKGESALVDPTGRVLAKWIKTKEGAGEGLVDALRAAFAAYDGTAIVAKAPATNEADTITVYPVPDLHLGMRSWSDETGASYDVEIATRVAREAVSALVEQSRSSSSAVVLILGDFLHVNSGKNVTPGSGHQLDVDTRWGRLYLAAAKLAIEIIDRVAAKHANVEVISMVGNHDEDAAVTLGVALSLFYSRESRISVNLTPGVTWYRKFGKCLFGSNHGHTIRTAERMAMAMADDRREDWGATLHRHIWTGHLHHEIVKEVPGVRIETLQSPAARDAWNAAAGYRSGRSLQAITFHQEYGEIGRHRVAITGPESVVAKPCIRVPAQVAP